MLMVAWGKTKCNHLANYHISRVDMHWSEGTTLYRIFLFAVYKMQSTVKDDYTICCKFGLNLYLLERADLQKKEVGKLVIYS